MTRRLATALALLALLAACSGDLRCANLPGGGRYCLQPTTALPAFDVQQQVNIIFADRRESLLAQLEVDADGMRFAALTPFGSTLVQASYDNRQARADALPDQRLDPALLLALLQIALWPAESVRAGLDDALVLEAATGQRRVMRDGILLIEVGYTGGTPSGDLRIVLPSTQMEFDIKTLNRNGTK